MVEIFIAFLWSIGWFGQLELNETSITQNPDGSFGVVSVDDMGNKVFETYEFDKENNTFILR